MIALVRPPTAALARCELTFRQREPIDVRLAAQQHGVFRDCLRSLGLSVVEVPAEPELPDACFVEDTGVVLEDLAVLTRPGAASRRPEVASVAEVLGRYRRLSAIAPPATLDGGDVLRVGRRLFVGRSSRTNDAGIAALRMIAEPVGYEAHEVRVHGCLHLLSACSAVRDDTLLINREWIDEDAFEGFRLMDVPAPEPSGASLLMVHGTAIVPRNHVATRALLEAEEIPVRAVDISEFQKAEAGVSCLALVVPR